MKSLIINKEINVNDINIKAGEIAEIQPDGSYKTKSGITIPSYIDIDNKKNFTKVVAMFSIGDFVVVNTEVFTIPNYVGIVADIAITKLNILLTGLSQLSFIVKLQRLMNITILIFLVM